ncbi:MAG: hypothetical protein ACK5LC_07710 [Coprobacillaceae bacterium]
MSIGLYFAMLIWIAPIFIIIAGIIWAFGDRKKDEEEYEENKDELDKY